MPAHLPFKQSGLPVAFTLSLSKYVKHPKHFPKTGEKPLPSAVFFPRNPEELEEKSHQKNSPFSFSHAWFRPRYTPARKLQNRHNPHVSPCGTYSWSSAGEESLSYRPQQCQNVITSYPYIAGSRRGIPRCFFVGPPNICLRPRTCGTGRQAPGRMCSPVWILA